jgi:predicted AAA+ superfamily ATPase
MNLIQIIELSLFQRRILHDIREWLDDQRILVLVGARQVGKTSVIYLLIQELLKKGIPTQSIFYFDLEDFEILHLLQSGVRNFLHYLELQGMDAQNRTYVFIDEIQYLDNPSNFLKLLADHHKNIKLVCSGSSTLDIRRKFTDSLVGRKVVFELQPLTFHEYLLFKEEPALLKILENYSFEKILKGEEIHWETPLLDIHRQQLQRHFEDYATYGGYPAVVLEPNRNKKLVLLREIYETYVRKDINQLFTIENITAFNNLVKLLALQIGNLVNLQELSTNLSISHPTVEKYLLSLENTFIIKRVPPFFTNKRKEIVKMPKVFFYDSGLRHQAIRNFQPISQRPDAGAVIENCVFRILSNHIGSGELKFWRTKNGGEVDFVFESDVLLPVEVKYSRLSTQRIPSGIRFFIQQYKPKCSVVVTKDDLGISECNGQKVLFLPVYLLG